MKQLRIGGVILLLLCTGMTRAHAQEVASSFDQLAVLVKPGDRLTVVAATGEEARGRLEKLSRDALILVTPAGPLQLGEAEVSTISQRRGDSLQNGAFIGAAAGAAYFATLVVAFWDTDGGEVFIPSLIAGGVMFAGIGAAAGAGIDAMIAGRQVIYQKRAGRSGVSVSPLFDQGRRGAAVAVRF